MLADGALTRIREAPLRVTSRPPTMDSGVAPTICIACRIKLDADEAPGSALSPGGIPGYRGIHRGRPREPTALAHSEAPRSASRPHLQPGKDPRTSSRLSGGTPGDNSSSPRHRVLSNGLTPMEGRRPPLGTTFALEGGKP